MKHGFAVILLVFPAAVFAASTAVPPPKSTTTPMKNAAPMQVDHLITGSAAKTASAPSSHASPKPKNHADAASVTKAATSSGPTEPPVVQYVPPKYGTSRPVPRQYVASKAPKPKAKTVSKTAPKTGENSEGHESATAGLVRVRPGSSLPAGKIVPMSTGKSAALPTQPAASWKASTTDKPAAMAWPAAEIYIVKDPELRWQQYSYP
ncbi:hypothetical protein [Chitinibacter sp. S2-10]|uniref:hypothetical protein n=1 Tax=Chitinibacter sp. S2-10 TaxID=3373597 RepID=UPI0039772F47